MGLREKMVIALVALSAGNAWAQEHGKKEEAHTEAQASHKKTVDSIHHGVMALRLWQGGSVYSYGKKHALLEVDFKRDFVLKTPANKVDFIWFQGKLVDLDALNSEERSHFIKLVEDKPFCELKEESSRLFHCRELAACKTYDPTVEKMVSIAGIPKAGSVIAKSFKFQRPTRTVAPPISVNVIESVHGQRAIWTKKPPFVDVLQLDGQIDIVGEDGKKYKGYASMLCYNVTVTNPSIGGHSVQDLQDVLKGLAEVSVAVGENW